MIWQCHFVSLAGCSGSFFAVHLAEIYRTKAWLIKYATACAAIAFRHHCREYLISLCAIANTDAQVSPIRAAMLRLCAVQEEKYP
jgi:hypothetical protein